MTSQLLTIRETSARLRIGRTRIYDAFEAGMLRKIKMGRKTFVSEDSVQAFEATVDANGGATVPESRKDRGVEA